MKNRFIVFVLCSFVLFSCNESDESQPVTSVELNKIVMLKVDFETTVFEGGKELLFNESDDFTISSTYNVPGGFGDVQLYYQELDAKFFDGTIVWNGLGARTFPEALNNTTDFIIGTPTEMPAISSFQNVIYSEFSNYPDTIDYEAIWNEIATLEIVQEYRTSNPNGKVHLFLYTPSVGIGNPAQWDWYVILKN